LFIGPIEHLGQKSVFGSLTVVFGLFAIFFAGVTDFTGTPGVLDLAGVFFLGAMMT
jgi:hypothetical protein|tara:strand:+ start:1594 stop:1761 length:168 start_codon:yes stop_codon:yes gene_type:complete